MAGTPLTGNQVQASYAGLLKTTDNLAITGSLKTVTDGAGNDTPLQLSSAGVKSTGTLAVTGVSSLAVVQQSAVYTDIAVASGNSGMLQIRTSDTGAINVGGTITLGGKSGNLAGDYSFAGLKGAKKTAGGDGDYKGFLALYTSDAAGNFSEKARFDDLGLTLAGSVYVPIAGAINVGVFGVTNASSRTSQALELYYGSNVAARLETGTSNHDGRLLMYDGSGNNTFILNGQTGSLTTLGKVTVGTAAAAGAGLNVPHGAAPTSPNNGDIWTTSAGLFVRINGVTVGPLT